MIMDAQAAPGPVEGRIAGGAGGAEEKTMICQRIGCSATFTERDNPEGSCRYHPGAPVFHDGMKGWSCCKKRSHDFSMFLDIPGCATGKHSSEKPPKPGPSPRARTIPPATVDRSSEKAACSRCRQGFFCSDHTAVKGVTAQARNVKQVSSRPDSKPSTPSQVVPSAPVDPFQEQTCKNKGCGKKFKELDNHDTACHYHPGPAIFHDRVRKWVCCDIEVKDFDEFLNIPPCQKGWHNANPTA